MLVALHEAWNPLPLPPRPLGTSLYVALCLLIPCPWHSSMLSASIGRVFLSVAFAANASCNARQEKGKKRLHRLALNS